MPVQYFARRNNILRFYQGPNVTEEAFEGSASEVLFFQNKPVLTEVMQTVESMANRLYGPRRKRESKKINRPSG